MAKGWLAGIAWSMTTGVLLFPVGSMGYEASAVKDGGSISGLVRFASF